MICDTSGLLAAFDATDTAHNDAMRALHAAADLVVSPLVVAELDYLLRHRVSTHAAQLAIEELAGGAYDVPEFGPLDLQRALEIDRRFADLELGITDASLVVLASRYDTCNLLTLDYRHFRQLTTLQGGRFRLLPTDSVP
ncbi:MAG: PIN domain-containing protein [Pseudonocardiaceae bacterium]